MLAVTHHSYLASANTSYASPKLLYCVAEVDDCVGRGLGRVAYLSDRALAPVGNAMATAARKTASFIKNNWQPLIAYVFAWAVILTCTGLMYGFQTVAIPLTIGLCCGIAFGIITGVFTIKVFDPSGKMTLWNLLNEGIEKLDSNGTRQIVLSVAVTVLLAASVLFPYVMGALFGVFIGNQIITKAGTGKNLGKDPEKEKNEWETLKQQVVGMQQKISHIQMQLNQLERTADKLTLTKEISQMINTLGKMSQQIEKSSVGDP